MKFKILVALLITSFAVKGQEKWVDYKKYNYKTEYPQSWTLSDAKSTGSAFVMLSPIEKNETFRENINLNVSFLQGKNVTLEAYREVSVKKIKGRLPNVTILENKIVNKDSNTYLVVVWTGEVGGMSLKIKQHLYVKDNKAYVLSYSATKESYNRFIKTANRILEGFKID
jgi:serine/threonine-protein kinase